MRQAALIHLERVWAENGFTAEGQVLHAVADKGGGRKARGLRRVMALPVACLRLNLAGVVDMVEFHPGPDGAELPYPVEYKRGKAKLHRADEVQLCAQALCLEEMTGLAVPEGALFYAETRRRVPVPFDEVLRSLTEKVATELAVVLSSGITPPPTQKRERCRACSLRELCRPEVVTKPARAWRSRMGLACACRRSRRVKKLLNTVYVTTEGAALRKDGENLVAEVEGKERARVPLHMLSSVVVFGAIHISPALMAACAGAGIAIVLLDRNGRFQARIEGPVTGK